MQKNHFDNWAYRQPEFTQVYAAVYFSMPRRDTTEAAISSKVTMAVVTLVLSLEESLPKVSIQSLDDVERVLRQVASSDAVELGAEILWTPEDRSEVLITCAVITCNGHKINQDTKTQRCLLIVENGTISSNE